MEKENETGYCNPPKESRFKPSQSGNPKGRPKGRKNNNPFDLLIKELESTVKLTDGTKITKAEAAVKHLCNHAASGDFESNRFIFNVLQKHQPATLAKKVFDKLIEEGYLTEEDAKDYLKHGTILNPRAMPKTIAKIYCAVINKEAWASASLSHIVLLAVVREVFISNTYYGRILHEAEKEYNFWQGFDIALSATKISKKERIKLINQTEKGRRYKRPTKYICHIATEACLFWTLQAFVNFNTMKDICKNTDGYENAEKMLLDGEIQEYAIEKNKNTMSESSLKELKAELEYHKKSYLAFKDSNLINEINKKDFSSFQEEPPEEELQYLKNWYENKHQSTT